MPKLLLLLLSGAIASAQIVPGRYVVSLQEQPMGDFARQNQHSRNAVNRRAVLKAEQKRVQLLVEQHHGSVVSSLDNVMNALVVQIPEENASELATISGIAKIYPVTTMKATLDHALPLMHIPQGWDRIGGMAKAGLGVKVALLDTGITPERPGFQDSSLTPPPGYPLVSGDENKPFVGNKIIVARNYPTLHPVNQPDSVRDLMGHGTFTAMCAVGNLSNGPLGTITGAAPKAFLGVYKITSLDNSSASTDVIAKAFDDAVADGMDVISLSFGSDYVPSITNLLMNDVADRTMRLGVSVVVSAGNSGPSLGSMGDIASSDSVISVGATQNDRFLGASVLAGNGDTFQALYGAFHTPANPVTAPVADVDDLDSKNDGCKPLPAASLTGKIALAPVVGGCLYETQISNVQNAGAMGLILRGISAYPNAVTAGVGKAKLPTVMISYKDGLTLKKDVATASTMATITFQGVPYATDFKSLASFSSRGPTYFASLKPDLAATGAYIYSATQSGNPNGQIYDSTGYVQGSGTSYSAPLVAGSLAVLRGARPGFSAEQYKSMLVNSADALVRADGTPERLMQSGNGTLNLLRALSSTAAAYPTSISFGLGSGTFQNFEPITITNTGTASETYTLTSTPFDDAPAPTFSNEAYDTAYNRPTYPTLSITIAPKQSRTVVMNWNASNLTSGNEYQGLINIQGNRTGSLLALPYWYGVPSGTPSSYVSVGGVPTQATVGSSLSIYFRVTDKIGTPLNDLKILNAYADVLSGGGKIVGIYQSTSYPGLIYLRVTLGNDVGSNSFVFSVPGVGVSVLTIQGAAATPSTGEVSTVNITSFASPDTTFWENLEPVSPPPVMPQKPVQE